MITSTRNSKEIKVGELLLMPHYSLIKLCKIDKFTGNKGNYKLLISTDYFRKVRSYINKNVPIEDGDLVFDKVRYCGEHYFEFVRGFSLSQLEPIFLSDVKKDDELLVAFTSKLQYFKALEDYNENKSSIKVSSYRHVFSKVPYGSFNKFNSNVHEHNNVTYLNKNDVIMLRVLK